MNALSVGGRGFRSQNSLSGVGSRFWGMEEEMDEIDDDKSTKKEVQKEDENDEVPDEKLIERIFNLISKNKKKTK